jgi:hypothetical protein
MANSEASSCHNTVAVPHSYDSWRAGAAAESGVLNWKESYGRPRRLPAP